VSALLRESEHLTTETRKRNSVVDRDGICHLRPEVLRRSWKCCSYETELMNTDKMHHLFVWVGSGKDT
jgi:hypothetical protein